MSNSKITITILGSCSGTEPIPNRHHTAWLLALGDRLYQFDAGENCTHRAHTTGFDLLALRALFISHPHSDHVGGLPPLLCAIRKLRSLRNCGPETPPLPIFTALPAQLAAISAFLPQNEGIETVYEPHRIAADGTIFDDGTIHVEVRHNEHLGIPSPGAAWKSYSFCISAAGRRIVYSGDVKRVTELDEWLKSPCDLFMMETGHHKPWEVAAQLRSDAAYQVKRLFFLHHGRAFLNDPTGVAAQTAAAWGSPVEFADDGTTLELDPAH